MHRIPLLLRVALVLLPLSAWSQPAPPKAKPTPQEAQAFVGRVNDELKRKWTYASTADWVKATYITDDTERLSATANTEVLAYLSKTVKESTRFDGLSLDPKTARSLYLLRLSSMLPAPDDARKREELATTSARLEGLYGKGQVCGPDGKPPCRDLGELSELMATSRKPAELLEAWKGWHAISVPMKPLYERLVTLSNEGAKELGFADLGQLWKSGYDMPPAAFEGEVERLWQQVKPLYEDLHCYVRARLSKTYGEKVVPLDKPIPAHLLGNMWAQEWNNIYPVVEPFKGQSSLDVSASLKQQRYDPKRMVKLGERFFTSLGLAPLPETFWERSLFTKPRDRDVVCHASAWDVNLSGDLRIKMCIKVNEEDLVTIHHELGHNFYYAAYNTLPALFQTGAHDGFHEAIGDALTLSITPSYLKEVGLLNKVSTKKEGLINLQLKDALDRIAFLPFGLLIDKWRWDVFSGKVSPAQYNEAWWALRTRYQGVAAPVERSANDFDPGAKYHIPASTPYTRYFLARILQFQFHRAMCEAAGFKGPLHACSIFGSKAAGERLNKMMSLGASKPWPDALEAMTGSRQMDASALTEYFAPLQQWLKEQNQGRRCGW